MKTRNLFGIVCGSIALAACGGGGGGGAASPAFVSVDLVLDVGVPANALSAGLASTSENLVTFTLNADNSFTIRLPDGDLLTLSDSDVTDVFTGTPLGGDIVRFQGDSGAQFLDVVEIAIGIDDFGNGLFGLARIDDGSTPFVGFESYAVFGNSTDNMPITGSATYVGRFLASSYIGGTTPDAEDASDTGNDGIFGDANVFADFLLGEVDVTLTVDASDPTFGGESLVGTDLPVSGSIYGGTIESGAGSSNAFTGSLLGGFYGPNVEGTAGTFTVNDTAANAEIVGGYGAFQ